MSPHTAHNCDGLWGWAVVDAEMLRDISVGSLLLTSAGLLLLPSTQLGELEAELDALGIDLRILSRAALELSLLDVDSERCNGNEARRMVATFDACV